MQTISKINSFTDDILQETLKFALGQVLPKSTDDPLKFNKFAMVAADILSSEAKVVTNFFMVESTKQSADQIDAKANETLLGNDQVPMMSQTHKDIKAERHASSDELGKCNDSKDKTQETKPDLFVIEG